MNALGRLEQFGGRRAVAGRLHRRLGGAAGGGDETGFSAGRGGGWPEPPKEQGLLPEAVMRAAGLACATGGGPDPGSSG